MTVAKDLTIITEEVIIYDYDISTNSPAFHSQQYHYVPFFAWFIIGLITWFISKRIILELIIRLRK